MTIPDWLKSTRYMFGKGSYAGIANQLGSGHGFLNDFLRDKVIISHPLDLLLLLVVP